MLVPAGEQILKARSGEFIRHDFVSRVDTHALNKRV
jgi:hypothetical protein